MYCILGFTFALLISVVCGSPECSTYDFPCANGECVDSGLWCDSHEDCADGSDEKYCKKASYFNKDPNKCPKTYFKCSDGPCIPLVGRCDGYENCEDSSDEKNCGTSVPEDDGESSTSKPVAPPLEETASTIASKTIRSSTHKSTAQFENPSTEFKVNQHSVEVVHYNLNPSDYHLERKMAREWLLSQRGSDFGWGEETPRALTALFLSDVERSTKRNESDLLMVKQLEVQLSLNMARNGTKTMKLTDLALYINALMASCEDPKNFHGDNLIRTLRNGVNAAQRESVFVNPSIYLTLCVNNATVYEDFRKIHDILVSRNVGIGRMEIQALALLTATCLHQKTNFVTSPMYDGIKKQFLQRMNISGFPGNVYEASLLMQALQQLKVSHPGLLESILKEQKDDGSFGGILATYLVMPVMAGRSFLEINDHCSQKFSTDPAPIEVLKNLKRRKINVRYSLRNGNPPEITQTIEMKVAEGITFLDIMRLAQEINPKYRFMLDVNSAVPVVYSIGGIPNDAEKGLFWTLHLVSNSKRVASDAGSLTPHSGNIKLLIPHPGDEYVFWMKSI